ncbi:MAG: DUF2459 domain-containing protein [Pseudomonadales bacterium]|nr:DUF2459 domain-containing protein [Pseudomonadales bacterium]MBO7006353.1 DUF2459 domain-containing protein [Pseudomonadales bacterium]
MKAWVYIGHGENHSEIVLRMSDIPAGYWSRLGLEVPSWAEYVFVGFFDKEYAEGLRGQTAALFNSPGVLRVSFAGFSIEELLKLDTLFPIAMSEDAYLELLRYVSGEMAQSPEGQVSPIPDFVFDVNRESSLISYRTISIPTSRPYNALNVCHHWVLDGFSAAGFRMPPLVYTNIDMRNELEYRFPRELQRCKGYKNLTSGPVAPHVNRRISRKASDT